MIKIDPYGASIFLVSKMSITLNHDMFSMLSQCCRDEILQVFASVAISRFKDTPKVEEEPVKPQAGAFESASLTFGKPLVLPLAVPLAVPSVIRIAPSYPIAKASDLYRLAETKEINRIYKEIDDGLFISNTKCAVWTKGGKHHHMDWDVKRVVMTVNQLKSATSVQIDHALPSMSRSRVTGILRELRKQGILIVG
jgi:hypothetical protein